MKASANCFLIVAIVLFNLLSPLNSYSCTAFTIKVGKDVIAAKSYDWTTGLGIVLSNPRGERISLPVGSNSPISWEARFGSITFNQYGQFMPNGGINEAGLVIEVLWLDDTYYPELKDQIPINELQWVQYHLDVCESVEEVIASLSNFAIVPVFGKLHYFVADKSGKTAIVEFLNGKAVVSEGNSLVCKVITNDSYSNSVSYLQSNYRIGSQSSSLNRFVNAKEAVEKIESGWNAKKDYKSIVDESFDALQKVWINGWTRWNIVYDINNGQIFFKTDAAQSIKHLDMKSFDFSAIAVPLFVNMNNFFSENIYAHFIPFNSDVNVELMVNSTRQTGVPIKKSDMEKIAKYTETAEEVKKIMAERDANHGTIVIKIENLRKNKGLVNAGIFNSEDSFNRQKPLNGGRVRVSDNSATIVLYNVPIKQYYAIGFFHDENSNERMDRNRLGLPSEPYGFSGKGRKFDTARFFFDKQKMVITVKPR